MHQTVPFVYHRTIKFGETDAAAMVYTPRFSDYCMEAAEVWFREYLDFDWYRINTALGMGTPVVHMEMEFKCPLQGADLLGIEIEVERVGSKSITLLFTGNKVLTNGGAELSFTGRYIYCFTSKALNGGAMPIPEAQLASINNYKTQYEVQNDAQNEKSGR